MGQETQPEALSSLIGALGERAGLSMRADDRQPGLFVAVVRRAGLAAVAAIVEELLGAPYKPAGQGALWKNWFDPFVRAVGGIHRDQTLYRKDVDGATTVYCAFWPWASDPDRVSVRLGTIRRS